MLSLRHRHPRRTTFRRSAIWCKTFHMARALSFNLFEHWNGLAWTLTLINTNAFEALTGVSADAIDDAWAVGWVSPLTTGSNEPLAIHWNATARAGRGCRARMLGRTASINRIVCLD